MKRIGVISDTHLSESGKRGIPDRVFDYFRGVDFILHAGDFTSRRAITDLDRFPRQNPPSTRRSHVFTEVRMREAREVG